MPVPPVPAPAPSSNPAAEMRARVVITGLGSVSALGLGAGSTGLWEGLLEGRTGIGPITRFDASGFRSRLAAQVPEFAIKDFVPKHYRKSIKVMARDIELAVAAAKLAVDDAGLVTRGTDLSAGDVGSDDAMTYRPSRMGCNIGAGLIATETEEMAQAMAAAKNPDGTFSLKLWGESGMENLTPLWLLKYLPNMLACHVSIIHGAEGPSNTITCSEASGLLTLGESMRIIERGGADLFFAGSAESKLNVMGLLRFDLVGRLAPVGAEADPASVVRPFDPQAKGGILGEGGGIVVLENADTAAKRGAKVYAEAVGFGGGQSDTFYKQGEQDEGFRAAVENALEDAGIGPEQVSVIVPQGSGVPAVDRAELGALKNALGKRLGEIPMLTMHGNVGNCVAGAGGLQIAAGALALKHQRLPARIHAGSPASEAQAGKSSARDARLEYALLTSGSLGGQNAAVVLKAL